MFTIQTNLVMLGFGIYLRPFGIDGKNGSKTKQTVRKFQSEYNKRFNTSILIDGIAGRQTIKALNNWIVQAGIKGTYNFRISEFNNKGIGLKMLKNGMDSNLLTCLETLRFRLGDKPIIINSGFRSKEHNRHVGGSSNSQHLYGRASDIVVRGVSPSRVYNEAIKLFDGVGKYRTFTHVDTRGYKARF